MHRVAREIDKVRGSNNEGKGYHLPGVLCFMPSDNAQQLISLEEFASGFVSLRSHEVTGQHLISKPFYSREEVRATSCCVMLKHRTRLKSRTMNRTFMLVTIIRYGICPK
jgi:hypothetical protein